MAKTVRSEAMEEADELAGALRIFDETVGEERLTCGELVVGYGDELVKHGLGLRCDVFYRGVGVEDETVEGKGVDDEELADVFGMRLGEHKGEQAAEGVSR